MYIEREGEMKVGRIANWKVSGRRRKRYEDRIIRYFASSL